MKKLTSSESGFTLVELMVVVAIIGVLSAIAVPNFKKYQAKSKTSEAKLQLSAAYTALQSFYSDYDTYGFCLAYMGFNPQNEFSQRAYAVGFATDAVPTASALPNDAALNTTVYTQNGIDTASCGVTMGVAANGTGPNGAHFAGGKSLGGTAAVGSFTTAQLGATSRASELSFVIGALGNIDKAFITNTTNSSFSIDQTKKLIQRRAGY